LLQELVKNTLKAIGNLELSRPVFYNSPVGLRFEIGNPSGYNFDGNPESLEYIKNALEKAMELYENSGFEFDVLLWKMYSQDIDYKHKQLQKFKEICNLDLPQEQTSGVDNDYSETDPIEITSFFWDIKNKPLNIRSLFKQIITADLGGLSELGSSVYFFDTKANVLFFLYDDRGLDIVAQSKESLSYLYEKYSSWIIDYDRKQIDLTFKNELQK